MGKLTTHVLDTAHGRPASGVRVELLGGDGRLLAHAVTNADGRCDAPLLEGAALAPGDYELVFHAGDYFEAQGLHLPRPRFIDRVSIRFGIADAGAHHHVPLLVTPFGYTTYRGS
jgi:5-hydroxyisourate hydrolase